MEGISLSCKPADWAFEDCINSNKTVIDANYFIKLLAWLKLTTPYLVNLYILLNSLTHTTELCTCNFFRFF